MNIRVILIYCFFCFLPIPTFSQKDTLVADRYVHFYYDNDFFSATDRYYTQGIGIELIIPAMKKSPVSKVLIPFKNAINYYGIRIAQDVFTPRSIRYDSIFEGERPYAGVFLTTHFLISINTEKKERLSTSVDIGIIGPEAKGEEEQKGIHHALNNIQPLGWENQIATDFIINYNAQFEKGFYIKNNIELIGFVDGRVGTLYNDIGVGAIVRSGWMEPYFKNLGLTRQKNRKKIQCYALLKGKIKTVGYNATLQGGVFNKKSVYTIPSADVERLVGIGYIGIVIAYKRVSLEYTKSYLSPEFKNGLSHGWGHCAITFCF
ncbi:MAG: lipid A deacylase LpxR family protein [Bacteroidota bacterium]